MTTDAARVAAKVAAMFSGAAAERATRLLAAYEAPGDIGSDRVRLAALKLCEGDADRLLELLRAARADPRDVVGEAEYPRQMHHPPGMATEDMILADRADYDEWLGE